MTTPMTVVLGVLVAASLTSGCGHGSTQRKADDLTPAAPIATSAPAATATAIASPTPNGDLSPPPTRPPPTAPAAKSEPELVAARTAETPVIKNYYINSERQSGGITGGEVHIHPIDRQPDNSEVDKLRNELEALRQYSEVARLDVDGTRGEARPPLVETTGISIAMKPAIIVEGDHHRFLCDADAIGAYRSTIARFPKYPFSYFGLVVCLQASRDDSWREYAQKAFEILTKTTTIDGHHPSHDWALAQLTGRPLP
jgi:hypothetical protein